MKTIIYDENIKAISSTNPLAVRASYDADDSFSSTLSTPDAQAAQTVKAATTGKSIYVTDLIISTGTAMNVLLQDSGSTVLMSPVYMAANTSLFKSFSTPLKVTVSTALQIKASTLGTVTITITGYVA